MKLPKGQPYLRVSINRSKVYLKHIIYIIWLFLMQCLYFISDSMFLHVVLLLKQWISRHISLVSDQRICVYFS